MARQQAAQYAANPPAHLLGMASPRFLVALAMTAVAAAGAQVSYGGRRPPSRQRVNVNRAPTRCLPFCTARRARWPVPTSNPCWAWTQTSMTPTLRKRRAVVDEGGGVDQGGRVDPRSSPSPPQESKRGWRTKQKRATASRRAPNALSRRRPHAHAPDPRLQGFAIGATEAYATNAAYSLINLPRTLAINHSTDACGASTKTLQEYFDSVYPLASQPAFKCIQGKSPANDLWFFYDNAPKYLIERVGGQPEDMPKSPRLKPPVPAPDFNFNPPKLWEPYTLFGNDNCTFYINRYPPKAWWEFDAASGVPSGSVVEVTHVKVSSRERAGSFNQSTSFNPSLYNGFFWYYSPGVQGSGGVMSRAQSPRGAH